MNPKNRIAKYYQERKPMPPPPEPHATDLRRSHSTISHIIGTVIIAIVTTVGAVAAWWVLCFVAGLALKLAWTS